MATSPLLRSLESAQSIVRSLSRLLRSGLDGMDGDTFCRLLTAVVIGAQVDLATAVEIAQQDAEAPGSRTTARDLFAILAKVEQLIDRPLEGGFHYKMANMPAEDVAEIRAKLAKSKEARS